MQFICPPLLVVVGAIGQGLAKVQMLGVGRSEQPAGACPVNVCSWPIADADLSGSGWGLANQARVAFKAAKGNVVEDLEIYDLARNVVRAICDDIHVAHYAKAGGSLRHRWSTEPDFNAWAESAGRPLEPPQHAVCLHYELARQLYRDCEDFCAFAQNDLADDPFKTILLPYGEGPVLPTCFKRDDCVKYIFISGLTWVVFHEFGHLIQEHGHIRRKFSGKDESEVLGTVIEECRASSLTPESGREAALLHVTELAADHEATLICMLEQIRQFTTGSPADSDGSEFIGASTLLVCALTVIFYRFNGHEFIAPPAEPIGGHPNPIYRLEACVPRLYELIDTDLVRYHTGHRLDRRALVLLYGKAMYSASFFCFKRLLKLPGIPQNGLVEGALNKPTTRQYFARIIELWDEISPEIERVLRFGPRNTLMHFSDEFREKVMADRG